MSNIEFDLFGIKKRAQAINSKVKGNANELRAAHVLSLWTGEEFVRIPGSGNIRWQNRMNVCGDLICTNNAFDFPFSVETKHVKNLGLHFDKPILRSNSVVYTHWDQCNRDAIAAKKIPLLLIRQNGMMENSYYLFMQIGNFQIDKFSGQVKPVFTPEWGRNPKLTGYWSPEFFHKIDYETFKKIMV